jgi:hypothetical protein
LTLPIEPRLSQQIAPLSYLDPMVSVAISLLVSGETLAWLRREPSPGGLGQDLHLVPV